MPDIPALLANIPDEFKPIAAIGVGALILVCLVLFHGAGLHHILVQHRRGERRLRLGRPHLVTASLLFGWSVFLMLLLHILEITTWAVVLTQTGLVVRPYDALYFCANAYTTLGFGSVDLATQWRNISPIIGFSGLFTFAWTTSALVQVVASQNQLIEQLEEEREQEKQLRSTLRKDEWDALKKERDAERAEKGAGGRNLLLPAAQNLEGREKESGRTPQHEGRGDWGAAPERARGRKQARTGRSPCGFGQEVNQRQGRSRRLSY